MGYKEVKEQFLSSPERLTRLSETICQTNSVISKSIQFSYKPFSRKQLSVK